jgi:hypothetical protein
MGILVAPAMLAHTVVQPLLHLLTRQFCRKLISAPMVWSHPARPVSLNSAWEWPFCVPDGKLPERWYSFRNTGGRDSHHGSSERAHLFSLFPVSMTVIIGVVLPARSMWHQLLRRL